MHMRDRSVSLNTHIIIVPVINGVLQCMTLHTDRAIPLRISTHSICTMEFIPHRPLYDWFIEQLEIFIASGYGFARLNLAYTVMSKQAAATGE